MLDKDAIRKKFKSLRKKKYFAIKGRFFNPLIKLIKNKNKNRAIYMSLYYPSNHEVNTLKLFDSIFFKSIKTLLPVITSKNKIKFAEWKIMDPLKINKFGLLEPINCNKYFIPHIMLVPLLAFDNNNNRLGYGKGYYDRFLNKYLKLKKNIITIGVAFSFQKYSKLPTSKFDVRLNYILTDQGIKKK